MKMIKQFLLKIYTWPNLSKEKANLNQKRIRDIEWQSIEEFIKPGKFLDVGCGAGYAMLKAREKNCEVYGIDPQPCEHGVGRKNSGFTIENVDIIKANAENIPFSEQMFDTVYSSHVLEHVNDIDKSLTEMKRVLKDDGVLIIGVPTQTMAIIYIFTNTVLNLHQRIINFLFQRFFNTGKTSFRELFIPNSHSNEKLTALHDLKNYRIKAWKKHIEKHFLIQKTIKPALYCYPEKIQIFPLHKNKFWSSSVFFVCKKYNCILAEK